MAYRKKVFPPAAQLPLFELVQLEDLDKWFVTQIRMLQRGQRQTREAYHLTANEDWKKNMDYYKNAISAAKWMRANLQRTISARKGEDASGRRGTG